MMTKEKFLEELKQRSLRQKLVVGVLLVFQLYRLFYEPNHQNFGVGFVTGLLIVFGVGQIFINRKLKEARVNPAEFDRFYIEETDEYRMFKRQKVSDLTFGLSVDLLLIAIAIATLYNQLIAWTLLGVLMAMMLLMASVHLYVNRKY